jgi:DcmR-like sensory protein
METKKRKKKKQPKPPREKQTGNLLLFRKLTGVVKYGSGFYNLYLYEGGKMHSNSNEIKVQVFRNEIPCEHIVQIYLNEYQLVNSLENFAVEGFQKGESVIIIATSAHLNALRNRLILRKFNVDELCDSDIYIPLNADDTLSKFIVNGWPDAILFTKLFWKILARARAKNRRVRAFGEMVALLWSKGNFAATINLEYLWNSFQQIERFTLFCAYPKSEFLPGSRIPVEGVCCTHSKVIMGYEVAS